MGWICLALPDFRDHVEGRRIGRVRRDLVELRQAHEAGQGDRRNREQGQAQEYGKGRLPGPEAPSFQMFTSAAAASVRLTTATMAAP